MSNTRDSKDPLNPTPAQYAAEETARTLYAIAHDNDLAGPNEQYRGWLMDYELEKFWDAAQEDLLAERRERPGIRGWLARRFDI